VPSRSRGWTGDRNGYASYKVADDVTDGNVEQIRSYTLPAPHRRQPEGRAAAPARTLTVAVPGRDLFNPALAYTNCQAHARPDAYGCADVRPRSRLRPELRGCCVPIVITGPQ
jgi:hypothetical protein